MKIMRLLILVMMAASVSGCVATQESFNKARAVARSRPDLRAQYLTDCTRRVKYSGIEFKRYMAGFMHTSMDGLPEKVCGRALRGFASGRMTFQDFKMLTTGQKFTPNMVAILRAG
jgi:hypothetical protein